MLLTAEANRDFAHKRLEDIPYQEACGNVTRLRSQLLDAEEESAAIADRMGLHTHALQQTTATTVPTSEALQRAAQSALQLNASCLLLHHTRQRRALDITDTLTEIASLQEHQVAQEQQLQAMQNEIVYTQSKNGYVLSETALLRQDLATLLPRLQSSMPRVSTSHAIFPPHEGCGKGKGSDNESEEGGVDMERGGEGFSGGADFQL